MPANVAVAAVRSYRTVSPLPDPGLRRAIGGLLSVALFRVSPRMAVSHHPALWSPDFPRPRPPEGRQSRDCLACFAVRILTLRAIHYSRDVRRPRRNTAGSS